MKYFHPLARVSLIFLAATAGFTASPAQESVVSAPSGFLRVLCKGGSDTRVSVPFHPVAKWAGPISADPAAAGAGAMRLSMGFPPAILDGSFAASLHYVYVRAVSSAEGRHFPIVAHSAGTIDIAAEAADLAGLAAGGRIEILPGWTLDRLFPPGQQTTIHPSTGRLSSGRGSEILFFDDEGEGIRLAPSRRFFLNEDGWIEVGGYEAAGNVPVMPGRAFLIRHPAGSADTSFVAMQQVYTGPVSLPVRVDSGSRQDTTVAPPRPAPVALASLDLDAATFEESPALDGGSRRDELLVYDNTTADINKKPSAVYFRSGGKWIQDTTGYPDADAVAIEPSSGLLLRKAQGGGDLVLRWTSRPAHDLTQP
jgi:uncharacterized protein (TIGR02597 family)